MVADTPAIEDAEKQRVQEIRATRLRDALAKRRKHIYEQLRGLLRVNFVLFICGIAIAAFFYHRYEVHRLASTMTSAMSSKLDKVANSTPLHQSIVSEEQEVNRAAGQN